MQNNRFVVLTGHLSNYPLSDLIGILRHQKKSGRLLIEYPKGPASLFFEEGELVDVRINELNGLQAICVLSAQPEASFNFNPLIKATQRTIDPTFQRVVSELFGCWDESAILINSAPVIRHALEPAQEVNEEQPALPGRVAEPLALPPAPKPALQQRSLILIAAAVIIIVAISTVIAVTGRLGATTPTATAQSNVPDVAANQVEESKSPQLSTRTTKSRQSNYERRESRTTPGKSQDNEQTQSANSASGSLSSVESNQAPRANHSAGSIKVIMQIENGRVLKAAIANHEPGMDSYEALALRIARQRRYPVNKTGAEAVTITVNKPE